MVTWCLGTVCILVKKTFAFPLHHGLGFIKAMRNKLEVDLSSHWMPSRLYLLSLIYFPSTDKYVGRDPANMMITHFCWCTSYTSPIFYSPSKIKLPLCNLQKMIGTLYTQTYLPQKLYSGLHYNHLTYATLKHSDSTKADYTCRSYTDITVKHLPLTNQCNLLKRQCRTQCQENSSQFLNESHPVKLIQAGLTRWLCG